MMQHKDQALADFITRLRDEIAEIEKEYTMQAGGGDLRLPIDAYHDAIDLWRGGRLLDVEEVSWSLDSIRKRAVWLRSGAHIFWQDKDDNYKTTLANAQKFKRWCIRNTNKLKTPLNALQEDLSTFAIWVKAGDENRLARELKSRMAEKFREGEWLAVNDDEFWSGLAYTAGFFKELASQLAAGGGKIMLDDKNFSQKLRKFNSDDWHAAGIEALKGLWLQIQHPIALKSAFSKDGDKWLFSEALYVPEAEWQRMTVDGLRLADAYDHYGLLYAAALAQPVDASYKVKKDELDGVFSNSYSLLKLIERLESGGEKLPIHQLQRLVKETDNDEMKRRLQAILDAQRIDTSSGMKGAISNVMKGAEQELEILEKAHFKFLSNQLGIYEDGKKVVKQLASQGINLAGKFVAAAAAAATARGRGGRGA